MKALSRKEKESSGLVFPFQTKREISHFHVVVVQRRLRNVQQKRNARSMLLFCQSTIIFLWLFSLPAPSSILKLPYIIPAEGASIFDQDRVILLTREAPAIRRRSYSFVTRNEAVSFCNRSLALWCEPFVVRSLHMWTKQRFFKKSSSVMLVLSNT